jgi:hypothetical protein
MKFRTNKANAASTRPARRHTTLRSLSEEGLSGACLARTQGCLGLCVVGTLITDAQAAEAQPWSCQKSKSSRWHTFASEKVRPS